VPTVYDRLNTLRLPRGTSYLLIVKIRRHKRIYRLRVCPLDTVNGQRIDEISHRGVIHAVSNEDHCESGEKLGHESAGPTRSDISIAKIRTRQNQVLKRSAFRTDQAV